MNIRNNQELLQALANGVAVKYLFFWGHQSKMTSSAPVVTKSCFSQWYQAPFTSDNCHFQTAEHYMMFAKAMLFDDKKSANKVLAAQSPGEAKAIGRTVANFNDQVWQQHRFEIVINANLAKFRAHNELANFLINTNDRVIVEASPVDSIWGIGMAQDNPKIEQPEHWRGLNLLGYALMEVRERLIND